MIQDEHLTELWGKDVFVSQDHIPEALRTPGTVVTFQVIATPRGPEARECKQQPALPSSPPPRPSSPPPRTNSSNRIREDRLCEGVDSFPERRLYEGHVKFYNVAKEYGFIQCVQDLYNDAAMKRDVYFSGQEENWQPSRGTR